MGVISGTTDINCQGSLGQTYQSQFKAHSDIIKNATDAIFFWGMNEVFANMDTESYFKRYQESIDTILGYGGRNTSNTNVYILTVIWVPDNSGYGGSFNAAAVEKFNETYIKPFAQSKGYTLIDIYEDSKIFLMKLATFTQQTIKNYMKLLKPIQAVIVYLLLLNQNLTVIQLLKNLVLDVVVLL